MLRAIIDSMAFRTELFVLDNVNGVIAETLKHGLINPTDEQKDHYRSVTGRNYNRVKRASSVYLLHHERGQTFTAIEWKKSGLVEVAVHGMQQYFDIGVLTDSAIQKKAALFEILAQLDGFMISRVDYAIDMEKIPPRIIKRLSLKRHTKQVRTTTYYQPIKQKERENPRLKIMTYDKALKDNLSVPMMRLEFALKSKFWTNDRVVLDAINEMISTKGQTVIKRWTGENVKVQELFEKASFSHAR